MRPYKIALFAVLLAFVVFSAWAVVAGGGLQGLIALHVGSPWAMQIFLDLVLALAMVSVFLWRDARAHGRNPVPWLVATVFTGSIAPLTYFLLRPAAETGAVHDRPAHTA